MSHTIKAEIEIKFNPLGMAVGEFEVAYPTVEIIYDFTKGAPEVRYQRNGDPGWPADPDEIEVIDVKMIDGDGLAPTNEQLLDWAIEWINDKGFDKAREEAIGDDEGDRADYEWDLRNDR